MAVLVYPPAVNEVDKDVWKKYRLSGVATALALIITAASFISFGVVGFLTVFSGGEIAFYYALIPFACFAAGMVMFPLIARKRGKLAGVVDMMNRIQASDCTLIASLYPAAHGAEENVKAVAEKMLDCGLLPDYEIVGGRALAKKSLGMTEDAAREMYGEYMVKVNPHAVVADIMRGAAQDEAPAFCPNCGGKVDNPSSKFCPYCGVRFTKE